MKNKQDNRELLLELVEGANYLWSAKFLASNETRFTISQLRLIEDDKLYASHLNLPVSRLDGVSMQELKKGQQIYFLAGVGSYVQKGWRRGTLKALKGKINIKIELDEKE